MARRYYIVQDGVRLYRETVQAISALAQKLANREGRAVQVHYIEERTTRTGKSHRKAPTRADIYSRNPAGPRVVELWYRDGAQYAVVKYARGGYALQNDRQATVRNFFGTLTQVRSKLKQEGFARKNPASPRKISKAKRSGQAKRGYIVEWKFGTHPERKRYANKGIATIAANELKRSGARSVRVYGA